MQINFNTYVILAIVVILIILFWIFNKSNPIIEKFKLKNSSQYKIPYTENSVLPDYPSEKELDLISLTHTNQACRQRMGKFNDLDSRISLLQVINNEIDNIQPSLHSNTLNDNLYSNTLNDNLNNVEMEDNIKCINFKNINQCMTACSNTKGCRNFYVDNNSQLNKCCMIVGDNTDSGTLDDISKSDDRFADIVASNKIVNDKNTKGKIIFNYFGTDKNNDKYIGNLTRSQCKTLCPKCVIGKCPTNYRCIDMTADPRYNRSCMITNNNKYDENTGKYFDNKNIPYMDQMLGLNEYPGYDSRRLPPVTKNKYFNLDCSK